MAKKKHKKRKAKRKVTRVKNTYDKHHLLWIAKEWNHGTLRELRFYPYCIIPMHRETIHRFIHTRMARIPPPSEKTAQFVLEQLRTLENFGAITDGDPIEKRLKVLIALFDCWEQPTADALREQLKIICEYYNSPLA